MVSCADLLEEQQQQNQQQQQKPLRLRVDDIVAEAADSLGGINNNNNSKNKNKYYNYKQYNYT